MRVLKVKVFLLLSLRTVTWTFHYCQNQIFVFNFGNLLFSLINESNKRKIIKNRSNLQQLFSLWNVNFKICTPKHFCIQKTFGFFEHFQTGEGASLLIIPSLTTSPRHFVWWREIDSRPSFPSTLLSFILRRKNDHFWPLPPPFFVFV